MYAFHAFLLRLTLYRATGFTLIELLITIAIMGILTTSGINYYQNYIKQTYLNVAKMNAQSLRLFLSDFYLQNNTYLANPEKNTYNKTELDMYFGWRPEGDNNQYTYTATITKQSWDIVVTHLSGHWLRCEQRMLNCCDADMPGATYLACP